jgi:hypothetical protein
VQRVTEFTAQASAAGMDLDGLDPTVAQFLTQVRHFARLWLCHFPHRVPTDPHGANYAVGRVQGLSAEQMIAARSANRKEAVVSRAAPPPAPTGK